MTGRPPDLMVAPEPWMRGTHMELDPLRRAVIHALELAIEDADRWTKDLAETALEDRPFGLPSVAFHLRHIARSLDRLLTYAENCQLSGAQLSLLETEALSGSAVETRREFRAGVESAIARIRLFETSGLQGARSIGRKRLPTTLGGLLVHCAEHTQRHAGQMVITAKLVLSGRTS